MVEKPKIVKTEPLGEMRKRWGSELNLTVEKARRLQKQGKVKIVGMPDIDIKKTPSPKRRKRLFKRRVTGFITENLKIEIPVVIPFIEDGNIGVAYNKTMEKIDDWILFIDHDVLLGLNPYWQEICKNAINRFGHTVGWFTSYTNRIGCRFQKAPKIDTNNHDIKYHREYARQLFKNNKGKIKDFTQAKGARFSGMFILTHRQAWIDAGGFNEQTFFNVDCKYFSALKKAGYKVCLMQDLYVYHTYFRETLKPFFKETRQNV